jgi:BMFP domain-containing protein YqiC
VLSKIIAEGSRRQTGLVPQNLLVELIQRPGEAVVGAVRSSVSAGQRTVEQLGSELSKLLGNVMGRDDRTAKKSSREAAETIAAYIDERLRAEVAEMKLATRSELDALAARVAALEAASAAVRPKRLAAAPRSKRTGTTRKTASTGGKAHGQEESGKG